MIPEIELQKRSHIKAFQEEKLKEVLYYLGQHSAFYQKHFARHRIALEKINRLEDLSGIPPTTKDDLQRNNWDFLCVPKNKIVEYTSTSGTLGKPVTIALTEKDLERLAYNESISFACADGTPADLYQLMLTLDRQFMAGIAYYEGIHKLGGGLVRTGPGLPALQWETIERLGPTTLVAVPSFLIKLIDYAHQNKIELNRSSVKKAVCIGESFRSPDLQFNTLGKRIAGEWNIHLYGSYASTEMQTAFTECKFGQGGHHHPELIIVEILDEQDHPVNPGESGELTITTLGVEGMPLLRYKTGDVLSVFEEPCGCGRHTVRLGPVIGRKQQMIKLKGTTLYPLGVFEILNEVAPIQDYVVEVFTGELGLDELKLHILIEPTLEPAVKAALQGAFQSRLRVIPDIIFVSLRQMERMQMEGTNRKLTKFIDRRLPGAQTILSVDEAKK
jgi:phenylacetate-CoA ligase